MTITKLFLEVVQDQCILNLNEDACKRIAQLTVAIAGCGSLEPSDDGYCECVLRMLIAMEV